MKSSTETISPTRVKLTVEVPFDELAPSLDAAYAAIAKQVSITGFRKGKVPARIIDQRVGRAAVLEEAVNDVLPKAYEEALRDILLTGPRERFGWEDITGLPWIEIDFPEDVEKASTQVLPSMQEPVVPATRKAV